MSEIKAVLYDLDGVLVDACDWHYDALNKSLMSVCGFKISPREHELSFNGLPTKSKLELLESQGRVSVEKFDDVNKLKQEFTMEILNNLTIDEEKVALHENIAALGIEMACVTNAIRLSAETMLRNTGQLHYMKFIISNQDIIHPKPCAEGYIVAMVRLEIMPRNVLIVEDSSLGIRAARSTGARVLRVENASKLTWARLREILI